VKVISIVFALATLVAGAQASPAQSSDHQGSVSAGPKENLARMAGQVLKNTNDARAALKNGDQQTALQDVNRAESDLQKIKAEANGATMVPVYQEFVSISILAPVRAEQNERMRSSAAKKGATQPAGSSGKTPVAVHEVAGDYTSVVMNTTVASEALSAAKADLTKGDTKDADTALADVQLGVQMTADKADMPLVRARENLILARANARKGNDTATKADLKLAAKGLSQYAAEDKPHSSQAKDMEKQVETYSEALPQDRQAIVAKINSWWNTTSTWTPYKSK